MATIQELELSRQLYHPSIFHFATDLPQGWQIVLTVERYTDNRDEDDWLEQSRFLLSHFHFFVNDLCVVCKLLRENIQRHDSESILAWF